MLEPTPCKRAAQPGHPHIGFWLLATIKELRLNDKSKKKKTMATLDVGTLRVEELSSGSSEHFLSCQLFFITHAECQFRADRTFQKQGGP